MNYEKIFKRFIFIFPEKNFLIIFFGSYANFYYFFLKNCFVVFIIIMYRLLILVAKTGMIQID